MTYDGSITPRRPLASVRVIRDISVIVIAW